jgi:phosphoglycerate dehydrogenase-like enzyme
VDLSAATDLGVMVCNTPGINTVEVAEHAIALLMALTRQVVPLSRGVVEGKWTEEFKALRARTPQMRRIAGSTVGIIGLGNIGRAFALRIRGFGPSRVLAYDPYVFQTTADSFGVQMVDFDTLLKESDFITIHAPDTPETHHMMGREQFQKMKRGAYIVNTARGPLIEPNGLYEALTRGWIAGAGLDVTEPEPIPAESPLLKLDNVVFTPHFAGTSTVASAAGSQRWPDNVVRVLNGQPPHGLANPDVLGRIAVLKSQGHPRWAGVK